MIYPLRHGDSFYPSGSVGIYGTYRISISGRTYMFCFSTLNANTNPNLAANAVPEKPAWAPTLATNTVAKPAWAPTLATNTVAKPAWAPTLAANTVAKPAWAPTLASRAIIMLSNPVIKILQVPYIPTDPSFLSFLVLFL